MGRVFRAYDTRLRRAVALKVLLGSTEHTEAEARVLREARAAAALNHPEAVAIFDVGEATTPEGESVPYIAMELVVGRSLRVLAEDRQLALDTRLRWLASVARVLAAAHRLGLVHRDVKPENVVVRDDGAVRVLDFGLARQAFDEETARSPMAASQALTGEGVILGTPLYMSPEQLRGDALDARTDQFSWAVMAYEILTGSLPWKHKESVRVVAEILAVEPPPVRALAPDAPADVAAVVERALAKDPAKRLATMDAIVEVLERHVRPASGPAPRAPSVPPTEPSVPAAGPPPTTGSNVAAARPTRRTGLAVLLAGGVLAVALGAVAFRARSGASRPPAASEAIAPPSASASAFVRTPDLPAPASTNPDAVAAYREGVTAWHDGLNTGFMPLDRALALDPTMAAAAVRLLEIFVEGDQYEKARTYYRSALAHGDRLTEHDRAVCTALEPGLMADPANWAETIRRFRALTESHPGDEDSLHMLDLTIRIGDPSPAGHAEAGRLLQALVDADPSFGMAWADLAREAVFAGRGAEARAIAERCLVNAPRSTHCLDALMLVDTLEGDCRSALSMARRWVTISPEDRWGYFFVASSLAALGEPWESVEASVAQAVAHARPEDREARGHDWATSIAVLQGDFARADASAEQLSRSETPAFDTRDLAIVRRVDLALERGDDARAAALAAAYLRSRGAYLPPPLEADPTPTLLEAEQRGGLLSRDELRARMDRWREDWERRLGGQPPPDLWTLARAPLVTNADEAAAALASRPPLDELLPNLEPRVVGVVSLLAGRDDEAAPLLARAAHTCNVLDDPFEVVRASAALGLVREHLGDRGGACEAYGEVVRHWGSAKPRSRTADRAFARMRALGCPAVH
jgi:serine/threonine-protein kinase